MRNQREPPPPAEAAAAIIALAEEKARSLLALAESKRGWHLAKEIPLALIGALVLQTAGGIWWMAQLSSKLDVAVLAIAEFRNERYTKDDARRERELIEQKLSSQQTSDRDLDRRISGVETKLDRVLAK